MIRRYSSFEDATAAANYFTKLYNKYYTANKHSIYNCWTITARYDVKFIAARK